ncbi:aminotransferase class III-fold pyridoxal phosphate-dependent enzyme [Microtetraspora malaysiensis]|uniref:aminotransferase class III-fold pyridoxal phosphate-dependent enzyme n=1 Tax=Microtetraspora malaysiensis TaxID=161358 RepID=UPI00083140B3|nr:aminotransferase class III-fold pyridoxal phosphate-dependent enzyme [Microtetraspora malaysiensis]
MTHTPGQTEESLEILRRRRRAVFPGSYRLFYNAPLHMVRGEGVWLQDGAGTRYLDCYNNVPSVGHCNARVVEAMTRQAATLNTHTRYLDTKVLDYAERLLGHFPDPLDRVFFTCSGSEANDLACRLARSATGAEGMIVTEHAFHGSTTTTAGISPSLGTGTDAWVRTVRIDDLRVADGPDAARVLLERTRAAIAELAEAGFGTATLMLDSIVSSDGVIDGPPGFIGPAVEAVRAAGGLWIADEVQAGFARLGAGMWGYQRHALVPDIVTLGKPMGNGHPLAGVVSGAEICAAFAARTRYFNTFGGNPVAAAVGDAVLGEIEDRALVAHAAEVGGYLRTLLAQVAADVPCVVDVRGSGLFIGIELTGTDGDVATGGATAAAVVERLRDRRVLVGTTGVNGNVVKIRPPLIFEAQHADLLATELATAFQALPA